ncbi:DUF2500 domain-containing protein [uncultured Clostridium sp.]|uniref:DUF2500 domain-containing protein n=1 Tax=uncultured Clostridium sp. TaxID=59620 RepID=UPI0028EDAB9F|nr:DUF2500 domain-containing protein [uncultured Clostridium sp.]
MFNSFGLLFNLVPLFIFCMIIFIVFNGIKEWSKNNKSPLLTVDAKVVTKRCHVNHHANGAANNISSSSSSTYYVTFEVDSGDRIEFHVDGSEYGILVEGDIGKLTFQGTRYKNFERNF